jgi:arsenate reductase-like glutaredoxin family protein
MLTEPAMIKRPVLTIGPRLTVGFQPTEWAKLI